VAIGYLPSEEPDAEETCGWIEQAGRRSLRLLGDIQDERHSEETIERAFAELGRVDILVNNAAFQNTHDSIEDRICSRTRRPKARS
jgi:NAD(P)-dependent dehydrogenase (short-subunit alcohol dehydrogenase family)